MHISVVGLQIIVQDIYLLDQQFEPVLVVSLLVGLEVPYIREYVNNKLICVTPGIRPVANDDDQKRVVDVATAFKSGSDYIVVGRPIKNAENRYNAASNIQKIIKKTFESV